MKKMGFPDASDPGAVVDLKWVWDSPRGQLFPRPSLDTRVPLFEKERDSVGGGGGFIHSFNRYLLRTYYVPGSAVGIEDTTETTGP